MKSFNEWFEEKHLSLSIHANAGFEKDLEVKNIAKSAFTAGQQSKQAEIDELQNKYDAMYRAFTVADDCRKEWHRCYVGVCQREDELQKRIDEALHEADESCGVSVDAFVKLNRILKGNSHES